MTQLQNGLYPHQVDGIKFLTQHGRAILADDMGINDVTMNGGGLAALGVPTPNIDSIARDGVRFDNGYAGAPVCTVSRAALLTGRYPWRFGVEFTPTPGAMARVAGVTEPARPTRSMVQASETCSR